MACGVVRPALDAPDLSMTSDSKTCAEVRRALDAIKTSTSGFTLDPDLDAQLTPFMAMFQFERVKSPYGAAHALLLLYAPFGVALMVLRLVLGFAVAAVLPRLMTEAQLDRSGLNVVLALLTGTIVTVKNAHLFKRDEAAVLVANHISEFDAIALNWLTPAYILGYDFYKKMLFFRLLGDKSGLVYVPYVSRGQGGAEGRDKVREIIVEKLAKKDKPLAAFPEGGLTNGRVGLLQYHKFLFSLGKTIQPLAIQASDGPFPVNINDETSTFLANVLWYLFAPWHRYTITVLPATRAGPDEDPLACAQRVMQATAQALGQQATPFLYRDKIAFTRYKTRQFNKAKNASGATLAALAAFAGLSMLIAGFKLFRASLFVLGFAVGGALLAALAERVFADASALLTASGVAFGLGGVLGGVLVSVPRHSVGFFFAGAVAGVQLAAMLHTSVGYHIWPAHPLVPLLALAAALATDRVYAIPNARWIYHGVTLVLAGGGVLLQTKLTARGIERVGGGDSAVGLLQDDRGAPAAAAVPRRKVVVLARRDPLVDMELASPPANREHSGFADIA
ncbi:hypothetical protein PybrP1_000662 [[Pythium] brassicae (nom. inval.)]|nr:hypothetical protein PybrP1_000662 [[Pythium] brassicae (nom. inval.)]